MKIVMMIVVAMFLTACSPTREEVAKMTEQCASKGMSAAFVRSDPPHSGVIMKVYCKDHTGAWYEPGDEK